METKFFDASDVVLQSGLTHRGTRLAYQTWGTLNAEKSNAVVWMTPFGTHRNDIQGQLGEGRALDPRSTAVTSPRHWARSRRAP